MTTLIQHLLNQNPSLSAPQKSHTTDAKTAALVAIDSGRKESEARRQRGLDSANRKRTKAKEAKISNSVSEAQEKTRAQRLDEAAAALAKKGGK